MYTRDVSEYRTYVFMILDILGTVTSWVIREAVRTCRINLELLSFSFLVLVIKWKVIQSCAKNSLKFVKLEKIVTGNNRQRKKFTKQFCLSQIFFLSSFYICSLKSHSNECFIYLQSKKIMSKKIALSLFLNSKFLFL